jgi:hypothetical protein
MSPDALSRLDALYAAEAVLAALHRTANELVLRGNSLIVIGPDTSEPAVLEQLRRLGPAFRAILAPWTCPHCGAAAELPDACSECALALRHYARADARFAAGWSVVHAYRSRTHTSCGRLLMNLPDRPPLGLAEVPGGLVCRRCLFTLKGEYRAYMGAGRRGQDG